MNNKWMPKIMQKYITHRQGRLGNPLSRLLDKANSGVLWQNL